MGCDIHFFVERRVNGVWESADTWGVPEWAEEGTLEKVAEPFYDGRNYNLFAMLAGVRNYDDAFVPVHTPKGLPIDVTDWVRGASERWGFGPASRTSRPGRSR